MNRIARLTLFLSLLGLVWSAVGIARPAFAQFIFTFWQFEDSTITPTLDPTGNGQASAGAGLANQAFLPGHNSPVASWSFTNWSTGALDPNDYFQFRVDMSDYGHPKFGFSERRSAVGIREFRVLYSLDGTTFNQIPGLAPVPVPDNTAWREHSWEFPYGSPFDLLVRGQPNVYLRIYGYNAEDAAGIWAIDDVGFQAFTTPTAVQLAQHKANTTPLSILPFTIVFALLAVASVAILRHGATKQ